MTNAERQAKFQHKRKMLVLEAFRGIMEKANGSKREQRILKSGLFKVIKNPASTPAQVLRASELLVYLDGLDAPKIKDPQKINTKASISFPEPLPNLVDPDLARIFNGSNSQEKQV
jgi:hypothetical protein